MEDEKAVYYIYFPNVKNSAAENGNGWKHGKKQAVIAFYIAYRLKKCYYFR